jgi:hypothetical protein
MGGGESKLVLRGAIAVLLETEKDQSDTNFWRSLFSTPTLTEQDVFTSISPQDIRTIIEKFPKNIVSLFHHIEVAMTAVVTSGR